MAKNNHGLDSSYFKQKLGQLVRDAGNYTPTEMARALERLASLANHQRTTKERAAVLNRIKAMGGSDG